jgi:hypothetical protein
MSPPAVKVGDRFGRLTVIRREGVARHRSIIWLTQCDCGAMHKVTSNTLVSGGARSCGCLQKELASERFRTHGHANTHESGRRTVEYKTWLRIKSRCSNPLNKDYKKYGAKGIAVCDRWLVSFEAFLADMGLRPSDKHSIDRIDGTKGYAPENCRWATPPIQAANRVTTRYVDVDGQRMTLSDADRAFGFPLGTIGHVASGRKLSYQDALSHKLAVRGSRKRRSVEVIEARP